MKQAYKPRLQHQKSAFMADFFIYVDLCKLPIKNHNMIFYYK